MANPTDFFDGYELLASTDPAPAQGIFIPLSELAGLTSSEANATTGDGRKLCFELAKKIHAAYTAFDSNSKPQRMSTAVGTPTGVNATTIRRTYTLTFDLDVADVDMAAE